MERRNALSCGCYEIDHAHNHSYDCSNDLQQPPEHLLA
jgi:hypothetical protein